VSRLRYLNPFRIRDAARDVRRIVGGGGPAAVRVLGIGQPRGLFVPTSELTIEVVAHDGHRERFRPQIPIPFPWAWTYRLARALRVPVVRSLRPEEAELEVPIPGRGRG
jgi:hypothetical protein